MLTQTHRRPLEIKKILVYKANGLYVQIKETLNKGNNKIIELRTILQRESQNSYLERVLLKYIFEYKLISF